MNKASADLRKRVKESRETFYAEMRRHKVNKVRAYLEGFQDACSYRSQDYGLQRWRESKQSYMMGYRLGERTMSAVIGKAERKFKARLPRVSYKDVF